MDLAVGTTKTIAGFTGTFTCPDTRILCGADAPAPGVLSFQQTAYTVERPLTGNMQLTLSLVRHSGAQGAASVSVETVDGSARNGTDFEQVAVARSWTTGQDVSLPCCSSPWHLLDHKAVAAASRAVYLLQGTKTVVLTILSSDITSTVSFTVVLRDAVGATPSSTASIVTVTLLPNSDAGASTGVLHWLATLILAICVAALHTHALQ